MSQPIQKLLVTVINRNNRIAKIRNWKVIKKLNTGRATKSY